MRPRAACLASRTRLPWLGADEYYLEVFFNPSVKKCPMGGLHLSTAKCSCIQVLPPINFQTIPKLPFPTTSHYISDDKNFNSKKCGPNPNLLRYFIC